MWRRAEESALRSGQPSSSDRQAAKPTHSHGAKRARSFNSAIAHELNFGNPVEVSFFLELVRLYRPNANASHSVWAEMELAWNARVVSGEAAARPLASPPTLRKTTAAMLHAFNRRMVDNNAAAAASYSGSFAEVCADRALRTGQILGGPQALPPAPAPQRQPAPQLERAARAPVQAVNASAQAASEGDQSISPNAVVRE